MTENPTMPLLPTIPSYSRQRGVVLVVSLLILLVLTLLGISSLDSSVMEEKMASNSQTMTDTFQTAESAIKATYFEYVDRPATLVELSQSATLTDRQFSYTLGGHPTTAAEVTFVAEVMPLNTSLREDMAAYGIEVSGTGSSNNTSITTTQGYTIQPMLRP